MNKKLVAVVAAVLVLAGCSAVPSDNGADSARVAPSSSPTAAPLPEQPEPEITEQSEAQKNGFKDEDDWYLRSVKSSWQGDVPTDEELLKAGTSACEALTSGTQKADVVSVEGDSENAVYNNQIVVAYAIMALCPEFG